MIDYEDIKRVCARIAQEFRPQRIILFGSYAYGKPTPDSDVDLPVIMPLPGRATDKAVEISSCLEHRFPIDLLVRSPEEVRQRVAWSDSFLREVTEKGVVMYDSADAFAGVVTAGMRVQANPSQSFTRSSTSFNWTGVSAARRRMSLTAGMV